MQRRNEKYGFRSTIFILALVWVAFMSVWAKTTNESADKIQAGWKNITEAALMDTVRELCSEKYAGRLTGTKGYNDSAEWLAGRLAGWGLRPGGGNGSYFQEFPNPYTLVLPGAELSLQLPARDGQARVKCYESETDFFPGSTSGNGEVMRRGGLCRLRHHGPGTGF